MSSLQRQTSGASQVISKPMGEFDRHEQWVTSVAFSPDGRLVASGGYDNIVRIWNLETREEVRPPLVGHRERIRSIVFRRDGKRLLTASNDGTAMLWDVAGEVPPVTLDAFKHRRNREWQHDADIDPSGTWVATGGNDRTLRVWNAAGNQVVAEQHPDAVMGVAFIDETRLVSVCNDATIRFWELAPVLDDPEPSEESPRVLRLIASQRGHEDWIRDVAVSPDRRWIATASRDKSVRRWALPPGRELATLGGYGMGLFSSAAFGRASGLDEDSKRLIVYGGRGDGRLEAFQLKGEQVVRKWQSPESGAFRHEKAIRYISCSPDGTRLVTASGDQTAIIWNARTGEPAFRWLGHKGPNGGTVYHAEFSPDGERVVTASNDGTAQVWKVGSSGEGQVPELVLVPERTRYEYEDSDLVDVNQLAGKWRAQADSVSTYFWNRLTEAERAVIEAVQEDAEQKSEIEQEAEIEKDAEIKEMLKEVLNREMRQHKLDAEEAFAPFAAQPVIRWLAEHENTVGWDTRKVFNRLLLDAAYTDLLRSREAPVYAARFSRDGKKIVTADFDAQTATVWDAKGGAVLASLIKSGDPTQGHGDNVMDASFSHDGSRVITACMDGFSRVWKWDEEKPVLEILLPHKVAVRSAEYSPDGTLLLTAAADGSARLWNVPTYDLRSELHGHDGTVTNGRFSEDGRYIITTGTDRTVRVSYTDLWELYKLGTHRVTRNLTKRERVDYGVATKMIFNLP